MFGVLVALAIRLLLAPEAGKRMVRRIKQYRKHAKAEILCSYTLMCGLYSHTFMSFKL